MIVLPAAPESPRPEPTSQHTSIVSRSKKANSITISYSGSSTTTRTSSVNIVPETLSLLGMKSTYSPQQILTLHRKRLWYSLNHQTIPEIDLTNKAKVEELPLSKIWTQTLHHWWQNQSAENS